MEKSNKKIFINKFFDIEIKSFQNIFFKIQSYLYAPAIIRFIYHVALNYVQKRGRPRKNKDQNILEDQDQLLKN